MLTIVHVVPPYIEFPPTKYGGTERVAYYLLKAQIGLYKELQELLGGGRAREVSEDEKKRLLCKARALLFPVEREEPFGLNVVEAMACGTPVLAFNKGAIQEIVRHGVSGFLGSSIEELARYVKRLDELDPVTIREFAWRFSHKIMALKYAIMYKDMLK
jgi:glycosyltransferase involved in cell wall biosynthesis